MTILCLGLGGLLIFVAGLVAAVFFEEAGYLNGRAGTVLVLGLIFAGYALIGFAR